MSSLPAKSNQIKGGLVFDATSGAIKCIRALRHDSDTLSRSDQVQSAGGGCVPAQFPELQGAGLYRANVGGHSA